ncbi:MAG: hypothetical protein M3P33_04165, partial [bacterium]|nr:hypothetical protein [bacterium]
PRGSHLVPILTKMGHFYLADHRTFLLGVDTVCTSSISSCCQWFVIESTSGRKSWKFFALSRQRYQEKTS